MTCIAAVVDGGTIVMGGDSAGIAGNHIVLRADEKVFRNGPYLFGWSGSFRLGQLLRYAFQPPTPKGLEDHYRFMVTTFVDALRRCLKEGGLAAREKEVESTGSSFLVGLTGHLYSVENDYQVGRYLDGYYAIGSGREIALGSLFSTQGQPPRDRIHTALQATAHHSAGVRAPFVIGAL